MANKEWTSWRSIIEEKKSLPGNDAIGLPGEKRPRRSRLFRRQLSTKIRRTLALRCRACEETALSFLYCRPGHRRTYSSWGSNLIEELSCHYLLNWIRDEGSRVEKGRQR